MIPCILNIETSTSVCSVALAKGEEVFFEKVSFEGFSHAALLGTFIEDALTVLKEKGEKLAAVAVGSGPGSYTGLRIGSSMAKGLCFGLDIPLIGIHTLNCLAKAAINRNQGVSDCLYCALLDARRMEVYAAIYDVDMQLVRPTTAEIVTEEAYATYLDKKKVYFFGNGAEKCKQVLRSSNALFMDAIYPLAANMISLSLQAYQTARFEDVAYFEPFYLKEFQATIAKNKVLGQ